MARSELFAGQGRWQPRDRSVQCKPNHRGSPSGSSQPFSTDSLGQRAIPGPRAPSALEERVFAELSGNTVRSPPITQQQILGTSVPIPVQAPTAQGKKGITNAWL